MQNSNTDPPRGSNTLPTNLAHALSAAERGFKLVPVNPKTKAPFVADWPNRGTSDPLQLRRWFLVDYPEAAPGIVTGRGFLVLDVDVPKPEKPIDGRVALASLEKEYGPLGEPFQRTPSGGAHYGFFYDPELHTIGNSVSSLGLGLDIRADGGQVLLYGEMPTTDFPPLPKWLLDKVTRPDLRVVAPSFETSDLGTIGKRNDAAFNFALKLARTGCDTKMITAALRAGGSTLPDTELLTVVGSAMRHASWQVTESVILIDDHAQNGSDKNTGLVIDSIEDVLADTVPLRPDDLVEDFIPADAYHIELLGHRGDGKTGIAQILTLQAAVGRNVFGLYKTARPVRTIFIEDETPSAVMRRREAAIIKHMQLTEAEQALIRENFLPVREPGFDFDSLMRLATTLGACAAIGKPVDLVVVDSRSTAWPGDADDTNLARKIYAATRAVARQCGTRLLIISHPPKAKVDARGKPVPLTIAGSAMHERTADHIIGIRQVNAAPLRVVFEWLKVRDGETGKVQALTPVLEPAPAESPDDLIVFRARGWVDLNVYDRDPFIAMVDDPDKETALQVLRMLREKGGLFRAQILSVFGRKPAERALSLCLEKEWIGRELRRNKHFYTVTPFGTGQLALDDYKHPDTDDTGPPLD